MSIRDRLRFRKKRIHLPAFGGDIRPPVHGPHTIKGGLGRLAFARTFLSAVIGVLVVVCLGLIWRTPTIMGTELFVADGSALGCHVPSYDGE